MTIFESSLKVSHYNNVCTTLVGHGAEDEPWNIDGEGLIVGTLHQIRSFHESFHRLQDTETIIAVRPAGFDHRLFTDHPFAFHFLYLSSLMGDEPMTPEQLHGIGAEVFDGDKVGEDELAAQNARFPFQVQRPDGDFDIFGDLAEHAHVEKVRRNGAVCNKQKTQIIVIWVLKNFLYPYLTNIIFFTSENDPDVNL
jgi:hypothetical protein